MKRPRSRSTIGRGRSSDKRSKRSTDDNESRNSLHQSNVTPSTPDRARPPLRREDYYSRDGVMRGALTSPATRLRVGIVASGGWTGWVAVAKALGWDLAWVAVGDNSLGNAWRRDLSVEGISHLSLDAFSSKLVVDSRIGILLLDDRLPTRASSIWDAPLLRCVIASVRSRRGSVGSGWVSRPLPWTHSNCGGVTGATGLLYHVVRTSESIMTLPQRPRRQLTSILSTTEGGRSTGPPSLAAWPPLVTMTGRSGFHGDGLFPPESADPWIDMPDCLSRSGWVRRKLSPKELLTTADVPIAAQNRHDGHASSLSYLCGCAHCFPTPRWKLNNRYIDEANHG
jgi:hypothetical protein